jgi:hypothetical protein
MAMHFPGRDLKPYAEPVTPEELVVGEVYFSVQYEDVKALAPVVETLVFVGSDLNPGPEGAGHYFQDLGSFLAGVAYGTEADHPARYYRQPPGQVKHIFVFENALNELLKCSLRRSAESLPLTYTPII